MISRSILAAVLLAVPFAGCGGGEGAAPPSSTRSAGRTRPAATPATLRVRPGACEVGRPASSVVSPAPEAWREGPGAALALGCLHDSFGEAILIGRPAPYGQSCVIAFDLRAREQLDELCEERGTSWTIQCDGLGCVHYFVQEGGFTRLDGPLDARVKEIRVRVDGRALTKGVVFARVKGKLARSIAAAEPFGYFAVFLRGCVAPGQVRIELFGAGGSPLGEADPWDVLVPKCPQRESGTTS
jgi:hypothetical protein